MVLSEQLADFLQEDEDEVLKERGNRIYYSSEPELLSLNPGECNATYSIESSRHYNYYTVEILHYDDPERLVCLCNCPYDRTPICKHGYAALFSLIDELIEMEEDASGLILETGPLYARSAPEQKQIPDANVPDPIQEKADNPLHLNQLPKFADIQVYALWEIQQWLYTLKNVEVSPGKLRGELTERHKTYTPEISLNPDQMLSATCNCGAKRAPLCRHAYALLMGFARDNRCERDVLFYLRDHTQKIRALLAEYGYSDQENWQEHFGLTIRYPHVYIFPKEPGLSKIAAFANWKQEIELFVRPDTNIYPEAFKTSKPNYGILWNNAPFEDKLLSLNLLLGKRKKNGELGAPLRMANLRVNGSETYNQDQLLILNLLFQHQLMNDLRQWDRGGNISINDPENLPLFEDRRRKIQEVLPKLLYEEHYLCEEVVDRDTISSSKTQLIFPQANAPQLSFEFSWGKDAYLLKPFFRMDERQFPLKKLQIISYGVIMEGKKLYVLDEKSARTILFFQHMEAYRIRAEDLSVFVRDFLLPLMEYYPVEMNGVDLEVDQVDASTIRLHQKVYLKEVEDQLLLIPALVYETASGQTQEVNMDGGTAIVFHEETQSTVSVLPRDHARESTFWEHIRNLHPKFAYADSHYFSLSHDQVMRKNWFFKAFDELRRLNIEVLGLKELTSMKYSPFRPQVRLQASSGTDWFDLEMEVSFGEQKVKLSEIRKAVLNNQQYVQLGDGSIGILPEEWLKKYSSLFKVGKVNKDNIQLSEFQLSLIDDLYQEIDNGEVFEAFLEKREKLKSFKKIRKTVLPKKLKAKLRNYQKFGYNWLNFLDEFKWGGCLADDMGLGKTVQMLALLMRVSEQHPGATHLIVVPRSLVFNWVNEVEKFCPGLTILRHTGQDRIREVEHFDDYDLVVTTYGLVRSDIRLLREYAFHYIVLDESQAIKNPTTQTAKSVKLLQAQNRLIMTGTPIENNTFDLFSQMDFVNPGMLGSLEGFRREFANPIDKEKNEAVAEQLRKLVYPFILSRKKREVAKELPEKTETVLYCEMPPAQRKVYDYFKDKYRNLLQEKIETEGFNKAGMYILQGLLKLRQICNSAILLNEEEQFTGESAKLELLLEMLEEIFAEGHKVLIFSFFKGMLNLIGEALTQRSIDFVLLTGESQNREGLVDTFKDDDSKKAFLISLKAGGFGLNLTEANYVFLIDPWWNPAVEQQAIDRTHRIGQEDKVFAYKMICKDTIEEKILKLQERKKALASDIIHTESGFLKTLKPKDVQDLFS